MFIEQFVERVALASEKNALGRPLYDWMTEHMDELESLDGSARELYETAWLATIEAQDGAISAPEARARLIAASAAFHDKLEPRPVGR